MIEMRLTNSHEVSFLGRGALRAPFGPCALTELGELSPLVIPMIQLAGASWMDGHSEPEPTSEQAAKN